MRRYAGKNIGGVDFGKIYQEFKVSAIKNDVTEYI